MNSFIALLCAVNVGGTGKIPMNDLVAICEKAGFGNVRTYIASGNALFESQKSEAQVRAILLAALEHYAGKPVGVVIRTAAEMAAVLNANPFPNEPPNRTVAIFLNDAPSADALSAIRGQNGEKVKLGLREIYVHYGEGMAKTKLKITAAKGGTARNMNTVAKLAELAGQN